MPPPEAPIEDVDTIVVDTSILGTVPAPAVGASPSIGLSPAYALGNTNQDAVSPASTQVFTRISYLFPLDFFVAFLFHNFLFAG